MADQNKLTIADISVLNRTGARPAIMAVYVDTINKMGGVARRSLINNEIWRRVGAVNEHLIEDLYSENQIAGAFVKMATEDLGIDCNKTIKTDGDANHSFMDDGLDRVNDYLRNHRRFGATSIDDFIGILDKVTDPAINEIAEPTRPCNINEATADVVSIDPELTLEDIMLKQINSSRNFADQLERMLNDYRIIDR